jgi:hypothetical protein
MTVPNMEASKALAELNELIKQFRFAEALDKFYSDDVITCENENPPVIGLPAYRQAARVYIDNTTNYSAELKDIFLNGNITAVLWHYRFDHKLWGKWDKVQLSVQRWKDGKIVHERHYYEG